MPTAADGLWTASPLCVSVVATLGLCYMARIKNAAGRQIILIILLGLLSDKELMCNKGCSLHLRIKPSCACVRELHVCLAAFREETPAPPGRRTPRCPARRTSPPSTSGRSKSWRWRWRKVSVCLTEEREEAFNKRLSVFRPLCAFPPLRMLFSKPLPLPVLLHLSASVTINLSRSLPLSPQAPRAAISRARVYATLRNPPRCSVCLPVTAFKRVRWARPPLSRSVPAHLGRRRQPAGEEGPEELQE